MIGSCEKCRKTEIYVQPYKGRFLCFECFESVTKPTVYKVTGLVDGVEISTLKYTNTAEEARISFLCDLPNAQDIDVHKL